MVLSRQSLVAQMGHAERWDDPAKLSQVDWRGLSLRALRSPVTDCRTRAVPQLGCGLRAPCQGHSPKLGNEISVIKGDLGVQPKVHYPPRSLYPQLRSSFPAFFAFIRSKVKCSLVRHLSHPPLLGLSLTSMPSGSHLP